MFSVANYLLVYLALLLLLVSLCEWAQVADAVPSTTTTPSPIRVLNSTDGVVKDEWREIAIAKPKSKPFSSAGFLPPQSYLSKGSSEKVRSVLSAQASRTRSFFADTDSCDNLHLHKTEGSIHSPGYPTINTSNRTSCTWYIVGQPKDVITIR